MVWTEDRDPKGTSPLKIHEVEFAGLTLNEKMNQVITRINSNQANIYVVTALDEVAWLLNMRGNDIPYNPMFFAYVLVFADKNHTYIFAWNLNSKNTLRYVFFSRVYIDKKRILDHENLKSHLNGIKIADYDQIYSDLGSLSNSYKIWVSPMSSYAIYNAVSNKTNLVNNNPSPVRSIKAVKNDVEINNTRICQVKFF